MTDLDKINEPVAPLNSTAEKIQDAILAITEATVSCGSPFLGYLSSIKNNYLLARQERTINFILNALKILSI